MDKINRDTLSKYMDDMIERGRKRIEQQAKVEAAKCEEPQERRDMFLESVKQTLGIEGRVIRVFKRKANAPPTEVKSKGWLFKEVMKSE